MRIDTISDNNFCGKYIISDKLPQKEREFAEKLINYRLFGIKNNVYLGAKNFDVLVSKASNNQSTHPKLNFQIGIKHLGTNANERGMEITTVKSETVKLEDGEHLGAIALRNLIDGAQIYIDKNLPAQYNTNFQKFIVKAKMFFGII